jgi:hypothetical protein
MTTITVNPVYGYGWRRGASAEPVPAPCKIQTSHRTSSEIVGKVIETGHPYLNYWLVLGLRTSSPEGGDYFNVYMYEQEPSIVEGDLDRTTHKPLVTGFATFRE